MMEDLKQINACSRTVNQQPFATQALIHQLEWRKNQSNITKERGTWNGIGYDHILPAEDWLQGIWTDIRKPLTRYLEVSKIQANNNKSNLKSSWTQCANIFFPFRIDGNARRMLASFLSRQLGIDVNSIDDVELEYAADGKLSPSQLLGESDGMRGAGQTSPDVAILFTCDDGKCGIYLIENKYTEHHFYSCSAASNTLDKAHTDKGREINPDPERCKHIQALLQNYQGECHQASASWKRQYWHILCKSMDEDTFNRLPYCPAMRDGYQLFRQQALAQGIADFGLFDYVYSGVAYDARNEELVTCLNRVGIPDFRTVWPKLFNTAVRFLCYTHQDLVKWVNRSKSTFINKWGKYIIERYDY